MDKRKKSVEKVSPLYETNTPYVILTINLKEHHHALRKWFIHGTKHHMED